MTQLGLGMYTLADAARLIHGDRRAIKRSLYGYDCVRLFEITPKQVESAVRFEEKLLQAA